MLATIHVSFSYKRLSFFQVCRSLTLSCDSKLSTVYRAAINQFLINNIPDAEESARYLMCDAANIDYKLSTFKKNNDITLSEQELSKYSSHCQRRLKREPIQYIIGNWDFCGFTVKCSPPVLIPRPETEELVERILISGVLGNTASGAPRILDIGSGSGVIGIALLAEAPQATCVAIDIDSSAVALSRENMKSVLCSACSQHNERQTTPHSCCRYDVKHCSIAEFCADESNAGKFDLIVSNPPYIPSADMNGLAPELLEYESALALDGGSTGLDVVHQIISSAACLLSPSGSRELWMEVSHTHPQAIQLLLQTNNKVSGAQRTEGVAAEKTEIQKHKGSFQYVEGIRDGYGHWRFVRLRLSD